MTSLDASALTDDAGGLAFLACTIGRIDARPDRDTRFGRAPNADARSARVTDLRIRQTKVPPPLSVAELI